MKLIETKDPLLLLHQPLHNILFLVWNEYNALTTTYKQFKAPAGYKAITEFCREIQVACATTQNVPPPITPAAKAAIEIAKVMAEVKPKARSSRFYTIFLTLLT